MSMTESKTTMERLAQLERDVSEIKGVLVDHGARLDRVEAGIHVVHHGLSDRLDGLERRLDERIDGLEHRLDERIDGLEHRLDERVDGLERVLGGRMDALGVRLDRLIAVTIEERTL